MNDHPLSIHFTNYIGYETDFLTIKLIFLLKLDIKTQFLGVVEFF